MTLGKKALSAMTKSELLNLVADLLDDEVEPQPEGGA